MSSSPVALLVDADPVPIDELLAASPGTPRLNGSEARPKLWAWHFARDGWQVRETPLRLGSSKCISDAFVPDGVHLVLAAIPEDGSRKGAGSLPARVDRSAAQVGSFRMKGENGSTTTITVSSWLGQGAEGQVAARAWVRGIELLRAVSTLAPSALESLLGAVECTAALSASDEKSSLVSFLHRVLAVGSAKNACVRFPCLGARLALGMRGRGMVESPQGGVSKRMCLSLNPDVLQKPNLSTRGSPAKVPRLDISSSALDDDSRASSPGEQPRFPSPALPPRSEELQPVQGEPPTQLRQFRLLCSEVLPEKLFLSGYGVASDRARLRAHGITHVLNTAADVCDNLFEGDLQYLTFYLKDAKWEKIAAAFYRSLHWIEASIAAGGRVLIHCKEGVSRSATITIAYLMWKHRLSFEAAHDKVIAARPIINPNAGFTCQLLVFQRRLPVGRAIGQSEDKPRFFIVVVHDSRAPFLFHKELALESAEDTVLDPRFAYVVYRGTQMTGWVGPQCAAPELCTHAMHEEATSAERFEDIRFSARTILGSGEDPGRLLEQLFPSPEGSQVRIQTRAELDEDHRSLLEVGASSQPRLDQTTQDAQAGAAHKGPPGAEPTGRPSAVPQLYSYPGLDALPMFDSDDLSEDQVFLLVVPGNDGMPAVVFVWAGGSQPIQAHESLHEIGAQFVQGRGMLGAKIEVQHTGSEQDAFWDGFPNG
mmetsp:Transcript_39731/g.89162  ORF Transcript_39731/g.89162 Transcript_39731/m.89162 type:complete len:709 (+) Transcript_39731:107-2233(+)